MLDACNTVIVKGVVLIGPHLCNWGILVNMLMLRGNVKIRDAADFNSFLKLVLVSDKEKSPEQA